MNLVLKSCKADGNSMTLVAVDADTGVEATSYIPVRTCGGPFLQHDASVKQLVADLFDALNLAAFVPPAVVEVAVVDEVDVPPVKTLPSLRPSKGAA